MAARHHPDLVMCRKQPGTSVGKLCERCEGKCVVCDSYVRPHTAVRLCAECDFGTFAGRCTICGGPGVSDAYYCKECVQQEKDVRGAQGGGGGSKRAQQNRRHHAHTPTPPSLAPNTRRAEGRLPQGHQSGHCQGGPALHHQEVWRQGSVRLE